MNHAPPPNLQAPGHLPHPLTFFLTSAERREVLRALRKHHTDRHEALLRAMKIQPSENRRAH